MRLASTTTRAQLGLSAPEVTVEVHLAGGLPAFHIVGLVETAVRESRERVRAAIRQSGFEFPDGRVLVNLAPADLPKAGSRFDLAIAIGILAASGQVPLEASANYEFLGELAFSGQLRAVSGVIPAVLAAGRAGRTAILPLSQGTEASLAPGSGIRVAPDLTAVTTHLRGVEALPPPVPRNEGTECPTVAGDGVDLADVRGQWGPRRAVEIAAAGGHHLLFHGPPGTGKTMLAQRLPGLLPSLSDEEALETAAIRSLVGLPLDFRRRPFRSPHHTISAAALVGGGRGPRPGEITLAHHGVLFLDELPEFPRPALESLRQPLSTGRIAVARAGRALEFPASFQLIAAMNPCPCGYFGDPEQACRCSPEQVRQYTLKVSGPLIDRIDLVVPVNRSGMAADLSMGASSGEDSATVRARVAAARSRQLDRQGAVNARLSGSSLQRHGELDDASSRLLETATARFKLSARGTENVRRVARTVADLDAASRISTQHMAEALGLRSSLAGPLPG